MTQPRYLVRLPTMEEHRRWVDERAAKIARDDRRRRQRGRRK